MAERIYIAGPMTHYPKHNFPAFFAAERLLQAAGVNTINPARHDIEEYPDIESWVGHEEGVFHAKHNNEFDFLKIGGWDAEQIMHPDTTGIALLRGWDKSKGATAEFYLATWFHKKITYIDPDLGYWGDKPHPHRHQIVGLNGLKGSGKDAAAEGLLHEGWTRVALADEVRAMALDINPWVTATDTDGREYFIRLEQLVGQVGWDKAKNEYTEVRRLLQVLGTEAVRDRFGSDAWTALAERLHFDTIDGPIVVTDVRFPDEAAWIRRHGGTVIKIERPGLKAVPDKHRSEANQKKIVPDYIIFNDDTIEALQKKLIDAVTPSPAR